MSQQSTAAADNEERFKALVEEKLDKKSFSGIYTEKDYDEVVAAIIDWDELGGAERSKRAEDLFGINKSKAYKLAQKYKLVTIAGREVVILRGKGGDDQGEGEGGEGGTPAPGQQSVRLLHIGNMFKELNEVHKDGARSPHMLVPYLYSPHASIV